MPYQEFHDNWKLFSELIDRLPKGSDEQVNNLIKSYIEQNIIILNDVFSASIENLKRLQKAKNVNDVICLQARFTSELGQKLALSTQRFLNMSLGNIADYNEWLKSHCDLATD